MSAGAISRRRAVCAALILACAPGFTLAASPATVAWCLEELQRPWSSRELVHENYRCVLSELLCAAPHLHARNAAQYLRDCFDHYGTSSVKYPWGDIRRFQQIIDRKVPGFQSPEPVALQVVPAAVVDQFL